MDIEWDYDYYQPWSDNEWLVDKMMALMNEDITIHWYIEYQEILEWTLDSMVWTGLFGEILDDLSFLSLDWTKWDNIRLTHL